VRQHHALVLEILQQRHRNDVESACHVDGRTRYAWLVARRRNGIKLLVVEIASAEQTVDSWIALGLLSEELRGDIAALEAALAPLCRAGYHAIQAGVERPR
jgi:hypothetical protein